MSTSRYSRGSQSIVESQLRDQLGSRVVDWVKKDNQIVTPPSKYFPTYGDGMLPWFKNLNINLNPLNSKVISIHTCMQLTNVLEINMHILI